MDSSSPNASQPFPEAAAREAARARKRLIKDVVRVVIITAVFIVAALFLKSPSVRDNLFNIETLRRTLRSDDTLGGRISSDALFIVVASLLMMLGLPRLWVSAAAGVIYGAMQGIGLSLIATMLGAYGTYFVGRSMLRGVVERRLGKRINLWRERFRENGFMWTLYMRLFPLWNATLTSLICGTCQVGLRDYTLANLIGFLPLTVVFAVFGSAAAKGSKLQIAIGLGMFIVAIAGQWWYSKRTKARSAHNDGPDDEESQ